MNEQGHNGFIARSGVFLAKKVGKTVGGIGMLTYGTLRGTKRLLTLDFKRKKRPKQAHSPVGVGKKEDKNLAEMRARATELQNKISELYLVMGKLGAESSGEESAEGGAGVFQNQKVKGVINEIEKHEEELRALRKYLDASKEAAKNNKPIPAYEVPQRTDLPGRSGKRLDSLIANCRNKVTFPLKSEAIFFDKILTDLQDDEIDIKRLAVSELGKIDRQEVIPVLYELLEIKNDLLQAEVVSSLVQLDDSNMFATCKRYITHGYAGVRNAAVRGLYKSGEKAAVPMLLKSLRDENVEVRNASAMFLGWLGDKSAVPSLLQSVVDIDERVKKSALASLVSLKEKTSVVPMMRILDTDDKKLQTQVIDAIEMIIGKKVTFSTDLKGEQRTAEVTKVKEWYLRELHGLNDSTSAKPKEKAMKVKLNKKVKEEND
ncbi:MAG: HEAT repeat domain-containing protein [Bacteriovoracaceae bacterium]|nr:HEAT repeat domain-containing protein [Bacteriovoracaceae bacterium]